MSPSLPSWIVDEIGTVPDHSVFAGVDELHAGMRRVAEAHPELTSLRRCGTSRQDDPLWCLTIELDAGDAGGPRTDAVPEALVFALPHPNEPIGGLTTLHLAERLCSDPVLRRRLGHRWQIVDCADPDGLRLNEGWLKGPFTRAHYSEHFFRPAGLDQVEWTFPLNHRDAYFDEPIPETRAIARLIDEHRPALVASLHNSEQGGVYYYVTRDEPELNAVLTGVPEHLGLALHRGEPESHLLSRADDAVFLIPPFADVYDLVVAEQGSWTRQGGGTPAYAERWGALTILSELPYWYDPTADDESPSSTHYGQALEASADGMDDLAEVMTRTVEAVEDRLLATDSPLWRANRFFVRWIAAEGPRHRERSKQAGSDRAATVAESTSLVARVHEARLRFGGMLLRALRGEVAVGNVQAPVLAALAEMEDRYVHWVAEDTARGEPEPIEIRRLVAVQYAATIAAAARLNGTLADDQNHA